MVVVVLVVGASGSGSGSASGGYYSSLIAKSSRLLGWPDVAIENAAGDATAEGASDTCSGGPTATERASAAGISTELMALKQSSSTASTRRHQSVVFHRLILRRARSSVVSNRHPQPLLLTHSNERTPHRGHTKRVITHMALHSVWGQGMCCLHCPSIPPLPLQGATCH